MALLLRFDRLIFVIIIHGYCASILSVSQSSYDKNVDTVRRAMRQLTMSWWLIKHWLSIHLVSSHVFSHHLMPSRDWLDLLILLMQFLSSLSSHFLVSNFQWSHVLWITLACGRPFLHSCREPQWVLCGVCVTMQCILSSLPSVKLILSREFCHPVYLKLLWDGLSWY